MATEKQSAKRRRWLRRALEIGVVIGVFMLIRSCNAPEVSEGPAPDFEGTLLSGDTVRLADYRGEPVIVHFWGSWCPVCRMENGSIDELADDIPLVTVAMQSGDRETVSGFLEENGLDFPTVVDEQGELARAFGVQGVPASFVIGPEGEIRFTTVGYTTGLGLRARHWLAGLGNANDEGSP